MAPTSRLSPPHLTPPPGSPLRWSETPNWVVGFSRNDWSLSAELGGRIRRHPHTSTGRRDWRRAAARVAAVALLAAAAGFGGGVPGSFLHPGPAGPRGAQGATGAVGLPGAQGTPGTPAASAATPAATATPPPTPIGSFSGVVPISQGALASLAIADGTVYVFAYTVQATGTCDDFFIEVFLPNNSTETIVPQGPSISGTETGSTRLYLAPGNYALTIGATEAPPRIASQPPQRGARARI